ncbi:MAG: GNAT family N-acetyltransferase [Saprospiraceae bacterium]|nr:GNAT family N-acetyltransferase [Saprospiraceae bacterium]
MLTTIYPAPLLTTERLLLRPFSESDAPEVFIQRSDERILRYTGIQAAVNLESAVNHLRNLVKYGEKGEGSAWAICLKNDEKLIGTICLWQFDFEKSCVEIGYTLHPDNWGNGLGKEAVAAVVDFAFQSMQANLVEAYVHPQNLASIKLLERVGFTLTGNTEELKVFQICRPPIGAMVLETDRMYLCEISPLDAPFLLELLNTPDWVRNIGDRGVKTLEEARQYAIQRMFLYYRKNGFGFYLMKRKVDGAALGMCGLVKRDFLDDIDIGYALLPQFYGCGYAIEAAKAVVGFAKTHLRLEKLAAITLESNKPSIKLLEKLGLKFEKKFHAPEDEEELMLFGGRLNL